MVDDKGCVAGRRERMAGVVTDDAEKRRRAEQAYTYYERFDNVFTGPGIVDNGMIRPLPPKLTVDELEENLLIGTPEELVEKLAVYAQAGVDETIVNMNIGATQDETLESMHLFAAEVMPHFTAASSHVLRSA